MSKPIISPAAFEEISAMAEAVLGIPTLEAQTYDENDYYHLPIWSLRAAFEGAYLVGRADKETRRGEPTLSEHGRQEIERIAREVMLFSTHKVRHNDSLDFHEVHVSSALAALKAAYLAGMVDHHSRKD